MNGSMKQGRATHQSVSLQDYKDTTY